MKEFRLKFGDKKILEIISDFKDLCAGQDLNLHPIKLGYAPQTYASTSSATSASYFFDGAKLCKFFESAKFFLCFFQKIFFQYNRLTIPDFDTCLPDDVL